MNTEEKQDHIPAGKPASAQQLEQHEVPEVLNFLKENGVAIVVGAAIAVAAFVGITVWKNSRSAQQSTASTLLANAQTPPQFQEIINNYPDTPAAPVAYLSLAASYHDQAQYDLARQTYMQFQTTFTDHEMLPVAELGVAQSYEAAGNYQEALAAYENYLARNPDHFMIPAGTFGKARSLEAMGRYDEARTVYEDFITENPDSRWAARAETGLDFVKKDERAAK